MFDQGSEDSSGSEKSFNDFLLAEYNNIAAAHFNAVDSISSFVKYYIAVASLPLAAAVYLLGDGESVPLNALLDRNSVAVAAFFWVVALIGYCVFAYVINLRLDTLLYARTVNGIRSHFFDQSSLSIEKELNIRVLPRSRALPNFYEIWYFGWVVGAIAIVGAVYVCLGTFYWAKSGAPWLEPFDPRYIVIALIAMSLHYLGYWLLTYHREHGYLRKRSIGVDVDGVLNDHRSQFSAIIQQRCSKKVEPSKITRIPVHHVADLGVTQDDENAVFNWAPYWTQMPVADATVNKALRRIKNGLGIRIWVFTHRPWPEQLSIPIAQESEYWEQWQRVSGWALPTRLFAKMDRWLENHKIPGVFHGRMIRKITREWLERHDMTFDRLIVEGGNTSTADARGISRNRFRIAQKKEFLAFVEDDLLKAKKLAVICPVVFLIDQPYNQAAESDLPKNIVRVREWAEIEVFLKANF